jgi:hypothetical protein
MKVRALLVALLMLVPACRGLNDYFHPKSTPKEQATKEQAKAADSTAPNLSGRKSEKGQNPPPAPKPDSEEVNRRIQELAKRMPPSFAPPDNATKRATPVVKPEPAATAEKPVEPKPAEKAEPKKEEPKAEVREAPPAAKPVTVADVVAAMEKRTDLTADEKFQLEVLKSLSTARDRKTLFAAIYPKTAKGRSPGCDALVAALDLCAEGKTEEAFAKVAEAQDAMRGVVPLRVSRPIFCEKILGFGNYEEKGAKTFSRGDPALVYLEVGDFACKKKDEGCQYQLAREATLLDMAGRTVATVEKSDGTYTCKSWLRDLFWPLKFTVPNDIYRGEYVLKISVTDQFKHQIAEERVSFEVK